MAADATEDFACHDRLEAIGLEAQANPAEAIARFTVARPVAVQEYRLLRQRRDWAREVGDWRRAPELDEAVARMWARLAETRPWEPRVSYTFTTPLRRDNTTGRWCVFLDLEEKAAEAQALRDARIESLAASARQREEQARQREEARQRAAAARDQVRVINLQRGQTTLRETGVFGEVVNGSAEAIRTVRVVFEFLDAAGNVVEERTWTPILAGALIGSSDQPLPPGQRRRFGMRADNVTAAWAGGVRARVVEVEIASPATAAR